MRVGVDQPGREDRVGPVEPLLRPESVASISAFVPTADDALAADGDGAVLDHAALRVHR